MNNRAVSLKPRRWQKEALNLWLADHRGVVSVVTGGGKTTFAMLCIMEYLGQKPFGKIVIIVPTTALLDQWYVALLDEVGIESQDIALFSGEEKAFALQPINLFVINTARELAPELLRENDCMLVVDECHRAGSPQNALALRGAYSAQLGLSATPVREYDDGFQLYIEPALGPVIYEYSYQDALADGIISPFELVNVEVALLPTELEQYSRLTKKIAMEMRNNNNRESEERLKRLLSRRAAIVSNAALRIPVAAKLVDSHRGSRMLVFHERVAAADQLLSILLNRNHSAAVYHTGVGANLRRDNLRLYRRGLFDVLISCRALDEGLNVPETTVAIIASATATQRQRIQRLGRALRSAPNKSHATIYTIYATASEEKRLITEANNLADVVTVTWKRAMRRKHGEDTQ